MDFNEYQKLALRTAAPLDTRLTDLLHGALGVITEAGELTDVVKKFKFADKPIDWVNVQEEIGDILWYLALLSRATGMSLEEIATLNIAKLEARYKKRAFTAAESANRDLTTERAVLEQKSL